MSTTSNDLVSGLLAKLDRIERAATVAARVPRGQRQGNHRQARGLTVTLPSRAWTDYVALLDPESVLRLCRAHRDIIEMYVQAKQQPVAESVPHSKGRGLDHASAMGRLTTLGLVLQALAQGYGLTEKDDQHD